MKKIIKFAILLVALGLSTTSCENWLDVNTDPNNPTTVTPSLVLPVAQFYSAQIEQGIDRLNALGNLFMVNWSQADGFAWYPDEFKYNVTSSFYQNIFNNTYGNAGKQYAILKNLGEGYEYYQAIGKIMLSYHFQLLVDCYGDVPYTEALGRSLEPTPVYDNAQTIYEDLIVQLTDAIALIKGAGAQVVKPGEDDAMFRGDMEEWIRFANTLKLRILVRQSDMDGRSSYITTEIAAINTEGAGYITSDVGINPPYIARESGKQNIIWDTYGLDFTGTKTMNNNATCASAYIIEYLTETSDPRIDFIYEKPASGHRGVPQGLLDYDTPVPDQYEPAQVSNIGPGILQAANQPAIMFTLAESYFNQAEARLKNLITNGPTTKELYQSGITASFEYLGLTPAAAVTYYSQVVNNVNYDNSTNKEEAIITQKWIAVNGINAEQSWFDYTRTGYPTGIPIPLNYSGSADRPVRIFYPAGEYSSNGENVPSQPNAFSAKIFWAN